MEKWLKEWAGSVNIKSRCKSELKEWTESVNTKSRWKEETVETV